MPGPNLHKPNENFWPKEGGVPLKDVMRAVLAELKKEPSSGFKNRGKISNAPLNHPTESMEKTGNEILEEVAKEFKVESSEILRKAPPNDAAAKEAAAARSIACLILNQLGFSYPEIGRFIGRDHTTIIHSANETAMKVIQERKVRIREFVDEMLGKYGKHLQN